MKNKGWFVKITIIAVVLLIILLVIASVVFFKGYKSANEKYEDVIKELEEERERNSEPIVQEEEPKGVDIDLINSEIRDIGELATIEYLYTDAGKFEDAAKMFGKEIPFSFTTKSFIAKWDGVIKAGVKVDDIAVEVDDSDKEIVVRIPEAEILSHEIDGESIETLDEKDGLFNPIKVDDIRNFDIINKEAMEQKAIENGILEKAFENAKNIIYRIIDTDLVEELEYSIMFEEMR